MYTRPSTDGLCIIFSTGKPKKKLEDEKLENVEAGCSSVNGQVLHKKKLQNWSLLLKKNPFVLSKLTSSPLIIENLPAMCFI